MNRDHSKMCVPAAVRYLPCSLGGSPPNPIQPHLISVELSADRYVSSCGRSGKARNGSSMVLRVKEQTKVENPRGYIAKVVNELRNLLTVGARARRDPRRENFYEVENVNNVFYIYISPVTGNVVLLAKWPGQLQDAGEEAKSATV